MRVFDFKYFLIAVDPDERGGVPESVWERESDSDCRACDPGDGGEYAGGGYFLQSDGWEAEDVSSSLLLNFFINTLTQRNIYVTLY